MYGSERRDGVPKDTFLFETPPVGVDGRCDVGIGGIGGLLAVEYWELRFGVDLVLLFLRADRGRPMEERRGCD